MKGVERLDELNLSTFKSESTLRMQVTALNTIDHQKTLGHQFNILGPGPLLKTSSKTKAQPSLVRIESKFGKEKCNDSAEHHEKILTIELSLFVPDPSLNNL